MPWKTAQLGGAIRLRKEFVTIDDATEYKRCRVQLHAKGVVLRDIIPGADIKTKEQQVCRAGEFLVAEIDAKVGGFGIVPDELDGAIVSSHYFLFTVDDRQLDRRFLDFYARTPAFREQVSAQGTTNYAAIRPSHVLGYTIPLPPLPEQQRIVAKVEELAAEIQEAQQACNLVVPEINALIHSARNRLVGEHADDTWVPLHTLVLDIENGWSPACEPGPAADGDWGVLKLGSVSFGHFDARENKALPRSLRLKTEYEIQRGDFLMSRANTTELVGACALVRETRRRLLLCDKIFRFIFNQDSSIIPAFLDHVLKAPALREQIERGATGTSPTMKNISKAKILALRIPALKLEQQRRIVSHLDELQAKVDSLKALQAQSAAEVDALLPSILDRAFKGELE